MAQYRLSASRKSSLPARLIDFAILVKARHWTVQYGWLAQHRYALNADLTVAHTQRGHQAKSRTFVFTPQFARSLPSQVPGAPDR